MDRRQKKTRAAIFQAFSALLSEKNYSRITVQEIIDRANVGRTTFYAHFETKEELLKALCGELFGHIIDTAKGLPHGHYHYACGDQQDAVFLHLLRHLQENDGNILGLLSGESSELFLRYFKDSLCELIQSQFIAQNRRANFDLPQDFLVNHLCGSFVEMALWWIKGGMKQTPEELDRYFRAVIEPVV